MRDFLEKDVLGIPVTLLLAIAAPFVAHGLLYAQEVKSLLLKPQVVREVQVQRVVVTATPTATPSATPTYLRLYPTRSYSPAPLIKPTQ